MLCHLPCSCVAEMILIVTFLIMVFRLHLRLTKILNYYIQCTSSNLEIIMFLTLQIFVHIILLSRPYSILKSVPINIQDEIYLACCRTRSLPSMLTMCTHLLLFYYLSIPRTQCSSSLFMSFWRSAWSKFEFCFEMKWC